MSNYFPIEVQRNAHFAVGLTFEDKNTGDPLDITGWSFSLQVKRNDGLGLAVIANGIFSDRVDGEGSINLLIKGGDFFAIQGVQERVTLAYDLLAKDADGIIVCQMRGPLYLSPGVSTV